MIDPSGNLFGTTSSNDSSSREPNYGAVYRLDAKGNESVVYRFTGGSDGGYPQGGVIRDAAGNLYGTAWSGGTSGKGVVFRINPAGVGTVLHSFTGGTDGGAPISGLVRDAAGNLYGTAPDGGSGSGLVFKIDVSGHETVLYTFTGGADGGVPTSGVTRDPDGNLYGTTWEGGKVSCGVVYRLDPAGHETVLHNFTGMPRDGCNPNAGVTLGSAGNLYGTTFGGGLFGCNDNGCGVVYRVDPAGVEMVLYEFTGGADGATGYGNLIVGPSGNLFGTTMAGGSAGCGVVFELTASGAETVLHSFQGGSDGCYPWSGVVADADGNLYGTAPYDGVGDGGVVYKITRP